MNVYGSKTRTFTARNVLAQPAVLNPPVTLTYSAVTGPVRTIIDWGFQDGYTIPPFSTLAVHRAGLYCNFGDLFVYGTPAVRLDLMVTILQAYSNISNKLTGSIVGVYGNKTVNGIGTAFLSELSPGDILYNTAAGVGGKKGLNIVDQVINDGQCTLTDFPLGICTAAGNAYKLTGVTSGNFVLEGISALNEMREFDVIFKPVTGAVPVTATQYIVVSAVPVAEADFDMLTYGVPVAFAGSDVLFDAVLDIETAIY